MHDRPHRNRFPDRVNVFVLEAQLAHHREPRLDLVLAEMAQIEMDKVAVGAVEGAVLLELAEDGLRNAVARTKLHAAEDRRRRRFAQVVILQETVAVLVEQPSALGARRLGNENPGERQTGGMVLHHLHVLERRTRAIAERHPVARAYIRVGSERKNAAASSRAYDHGLRHDRADLAGTKLDSNHAARAPVIDEDLRRENLVVAGERAVLERGLEERVQHVEAGLVGGEPRAHLLHSAERTNGDTAVGQAAPGASPMLEPQQFVGHFVDEGLDHVLVAEPIAARDGVVDVLLDGVVVTDYAGGAAFGRDRVAAHRVNLRDHRDIELRIGFGDSDSGAESGAAATDQQNIVRRGFHSILRAGVSGVTGIKYSNIGPITI